MWLLRTFKTWGQKGHCCLNNLCCCSPWGQWVVWERKEGSSQPCPHLQQGEWPACWAGRAHLLSREGNTWVRGDTQTSLLPRALTPAHLHALPFYGCDLLPFKSFPYHPVFFHVIPPGTHSLLPILNSAVSRGERQCHQHHHVGAELSSCLCQ